MSSLPQIEHAALARDRDQTVDGQNHDAPLAQRGA
jgi:hypothetical protein